MLVRLPYSKKTALPDRPRCSALNTTPQPAYKGLKCKAKAHYIYHGVPYCHRHIGELLIREKLDE